MADHRGPLSPAGRLLLLAALVSTALLSPAVPGLVAELRSPVLGEAVVALVTLALWALSAWIVVGGLAVALGQVSRLCAGLARIVLPSAALRLMTASVAVTVAAAPVSSVVSAESVDRAPARPSGLGVLDGLPHPSSPATGGVPPVATRDRNPAPTVVRVRPGDTLWALAARRLPPDASAAAVARSVRAWHRTNLAAIGPDPDVLQPGQRLVPPTSKENP